ncbi:hypothetical protein SADUNF_Sadunf08G0118200 [Salix dunnii]|uniref:Uncharacterized protein n=1 Tax=Salix dunnii TaxID=1413687 RepID=A0A835MU34_9ROSI|nr:hypothetical protein SADUNF_Sadunf08G0118200 [Salix dunnii]
MAMEKERESEFRHTTVNELNFYVSLNGTRRFLYIQIDPNSSILALVLVDNALRHSDCELTLIDGGRMWGKQLFKKKTIVSWTIKKEDNSNNPTGKTTLPAFGRKATAGN